MNPCRGRMFKVDASYRGGFDETGGRFFFGINALYARKLAFKCTLTASRFEII
jgi:hypothetical protein